MIDWIKLTYAIDDIDTFLSSLTLQRIILVDDVTGELISSSNVEYRKDEKRMVWYSTYEKEIPFGTYKAILKITHYRDLVTDEQLPCKHNLEITGSPHCNHFGGTNYQRFNFQQLQREIQILIEAFSLNPQKTEIHVIEIGVNLLVPFVVYPFLRNCLLLYSGSQFQLMRAKSGGSKLIGFEVTGRSQDVPKVYDKGKQHSQQLNVLRWEMHYSKMQPVLKYLGKSKLYLSDLWNPAVISKLCSLLLDSWDKVLVGDNSIDIGKLPLSPADKRLLEDGLMRDFWTLLQDRGREEYKYQRRKFIKLTAQYGCNNHAEIKKLIINEIDLLSKMSPNLPTVENEKFPEFTGSVKGKYSETGIITDQVNATNLININYKDQGKKLINRCLCCGKDISQQKKGSRFCSSKFVGEAAAKKCRNTISNKTNNPKRKRVKMADELINQALQPPSLEDRKQRLAALRARMAKLVVPPQPADDEVTRLKKALLQMVGSKAGAQVN